MPEIKDGCVRPAGGVLKPPSQSAQATGMVSIPEVKKMTVSVGKEAIDFEANAYIEGFGFKPVKLSDYRGKWIVLCFYPGDFTFV